MQTWGPTIAAGIAALIALVGVALGQWNARRMENEKYNRAHSTRWDEARRLAYVEYASALKRETRVHLKMAEGRFPGEVWPNHETLAIEDGWKALAVAEDTRASLLRR